MERSCISKSKVSRLNRPQPRDEEAEYAVIPRCSAPNRSQGAAWVRKARARVGVPVRALTVWPSPGAYIRQDALMHTVGSGEANARVGIAPVIHRRVGGALPIRTHLTNEAMIETSHLLRYHMTAFTLSMQENSASAGRKSTAEGPDFAAFWSVWPRKVSKKDAERAWSKLKARHRQAAIAAVPKHVQFWNATRAAAQYIPHAATWLNGARWEDEIEIPAARTTPQPARGPAWWTSHALMDQKGREVGIGSARPGESAEQYRARIQQALVERERYGGQS